MDKKMMIEHIIYEAMMDAIEELTTSDYQGFMGAKAMNAARQILAL